jgi:hypothetical protein
MNANAARLVKYGRSDGRGSSAQLLQQGCPRRAATAAILTTGLKKKPLTPKIDLTSGPIEPKAALAGRRRRAVARQPPVKPAADLTRGRFGRVDSTNDQRSIGPVSI